MITASIRKSLWFCSYKRLHKFHMSTSFLTIQLLLCDHRVLNFERDYIHRNRSCKAVTPIWCARWKLAWGKETENLHRTVVASFLCLNQNQSRCLVCNCPTKVSSVASMATFFCHSMAAFFHLFVKWVFMVKFNQICHKNALSVIVL